MLDPIADKLLMSVCFLGLWWTFNLPTWLVAEETRKEVTVALTGDAGDELFAGYDRYRAVSIEIETEIMRRIEGKMRFAVCYADLDHFKEYNDRYSYYDGDRVIRILSKILHDVVKGTCGEAGFRSDQAFGTPCEQPVFEGQYAGDDWSHEPR